MVAIGKTRTVKELALSAGLDLDEALVRLWDAGLDHINNPGDRIPARQMRSAEGALEIENAKRQTRIDYWLKRTGLGRNDFVNEMSAIGVSIRDNVRTLPKGALKKIRKHYGDKGSVPPTLNDEDQRKAPKLDPIPPFHWDTVGTRQPNRFLSEEDLLAIHHALVKDFLLSEDPIEPPGVRNPHLLGSAINRPLTSLGNVFKYPTVEMAAAALFHSVVQNHCFHNGNKRTGLVALLVFLDLNSVIATCDEDELFRFTLRVAQHRLVPPHYDERSDREVMQIAQWVRSNSRRMEKGERPIPWHRLRRILSRRFNCESTPVSGGGNRIEITRRIENRSRFGQRTKSRLLVSRVSWAGDGTTVKRNTLNKIRSDLKLQERDGVDSKVFYEADSEPDDFVQHYRLVLRRLARL